MLLLKIRSRGLKGLDFTFPLEPATAIIGPNWGGKTTMIDSIRFLCCGRFPEIKKGEWPVMQVVGEFDQGTIERSINAKGTVATSGSLAASGDDERLDVPLLNPEYYFGLTDRERTNYLFERVSLPDSFSIEALIAEIERLSLGEEHSEEVQKAKQDLLVELREPFNRPSVQEALGAAIDKLRARYTYWNRRQKETQGAVTTLTELKLRGETSAVPANLATDITTAEEAVASANEKVGALKAQIASADMALTRKRAMEKYLAEDRIDYDHALARVRSERGPIAAEYERINDAVMAVDVPTLANAVREAEKERQALEADLAAARHRHEEATKLLHSLEQQEECPYCHSHQKGWKKTVQDQLEAEIERAASDIEAQSALVAASGARLSELMGRIESTQKMLGEAAELRRRLVTIAESIDALTANKEREEAQRTELSEQVTKFAELSDPALLKKDLEKAQAQLEFERARVSELKDVQRAETRLQQDLVRAGEAAREHVIAAAQLAVTKKVAKLIESLRDNMASTAITTLLETANLLTADILLSPLVFQDGVIGRCQAGEFFSHHWFSGAEKAIAYIAIAIALSAAAPFKLVLLDEFNRLRGDTQAKVVQRLFSLQDRGVIDQFILAGTHIPDFQARARLKVITLAPLA